MSKQQYAVPTPPHAANTKDEAKRTLPARLAEFPGELEDERRVELYTERDQLEEGFADFTEKQRVVALKRLQQIHADLYGDLKARHEQMRKAERDRPGEQGQNYAPITPPPPYAEK